MIGMVCMQERSKRQYYLPAELQFEKPFRIITQIAALLVVVIMVGIFFQLIIESFPAFRKFGLSLITSCTWKSVSEEFGAQPSIVRTLDTSLIAIIFGVPHSLCCAFFIK
jgi:phosphate transport system permease protein